MKDATLENKNQYDLISVSSLFYPMTGGLEIMVYNLLNYLTKRGCKAIAVHGRANKDSIYQLNGYSVKTFKTKNLFNNTYPIFSFKFFFYIHKLIKKNPDAIVLIHSRHFISSFLTALACYILKRKYFLVEHTAQTSFLKSKFAQNFVYIFEKTFARFVLKKADKIVSSSLASQNYLIKEHLVPKEKITVIYNGFDPEELNKYSDLRKTNSVVFATKMIKVKNPEVTYKAFVDLAKKYIDWDFHFIGSGDFFTAKETQEKNLKIVHELINREDILKLYAQSSIYVNSSLSEGLSLAIIEATYLKNIPVLSDAPSNIEIANRLNTEEYIFKKHDVEDLKNKLEIAIKEINEVNLSQIRKKTEESFNNEILFKKYESLLLTE